MAPEHMDQRSDDKRALDSTERVRNAPFESERGILMICGILCTLIFLLDVMLRIGFVASVLYVIPVLVCIWSPRRRTMFVVAIVSTVLTIAAVPLKPPGDELLPSLTGRYLWSHFGPRRSWLTCSSPSSTGRRKR